MDSTTSDTDRPSEGATPPDVQSQLDQIASEGATPPDVQSQLDQIAKDEKYAGHLLLDAAHIIGTTHAEEILMAAARKSPRSALYWFSQFDAPFAGRLFEEAAQADPLGFLQLAMHGKPNPDRFDKIRELIWKEIDYDPKWGGTIWTIEGQFLPKDVVRDFKQRVEELFGEFQGKIHRTLAR